MLNETSTMVYTFLAVQYIPICSLHSILATYKDHLFKLAIDISGLLEIT